MTSRAFAELREEARYFSEFLETVATPDRSTEELIERYVTWKALSADHIEKLTDEYLARGEWALDVRIEQVESELRSRLVDVFPLASITITRFSGMHRKL